MHPLNSARESRPAVSRFSTLIALCFMWIVAANGYAASDPQTPSAIGPGGAAVTYWPVALAAAEGQVEIYQPQPEAMTGDKLTARAAVSLTRPGGDGSVFGTVWFSAHVISDRDTRMVTIRDATVSKVSLSGSTSAEEQEFAKAIGARLSATELTFPLDHLMTSLDTAHRETIQATNLGTAPPHIVFSTIPAILISVNGPPKLLPIEGQPKVSRVANTPFILLVNNSDRSYYLKAGSRWLSAPDLPGPWADADSLPPAIEVAGNDLATPETQSSTSVGAPTPPTAVEVAPAAASARIMVVTEPTELIVTEGNPQFAPVAGSAGGELFYASNTASDLFLDQADHRYYVLLSGRWYAAGSLQGPWQYVRSDRLPTAFAQIPANSTKADVLTFVAGTSEAHEAVLDASIPQTATIRRDAGAAMTVAYDGEPRFQDVSESSGVAYALNTPEDILRVDGRYYLCHQAVWYESASPTSPWTVSISVPPAVYTLPPSCPAYHVRYVNVYASSADNVSVGYLPGYTGTYVDGSTIVYGTGYDYPGWYGTAYFPVLCTWGFDAYYDPFACAWGFDAGEYWGGTGWFAHPRHERWWRENPGERWGQHRWWGPAGFVHSHEIRDHLMNARADGAFRVGERGAALAARMPGMDHREPGWNNLYARNGNAVRVGTSPRRESAPAKVATGPRDNVFSGSDGRVFRRSNSGWEQHGGASGGWTGVNRIPEAHTTYHPAPVPTHVYSSFASSHAGLEQHSAARFRGAYRSSAIHSFSGGGSHGGGHGGGGHR